MSYFFPITAELVAPLNLRPTTPCDTCDIATPRTDANPDCRNVAGVASPPTLKNAAWWRDLFEERAAIREHDGGLSRADAEAGALADLAADWRALNPLPAAADAAATDAACAHCGKSGPDTPVLAVGGHAWLHRACWAPMDAERQVDALAAVRALVL